MVSFPPSLGVKSPRPERAVGELGASERLGRAGRTQTLHGVARSRPAGRYNSSADNAAGHSPGIIPQRGNVLATKGTGRSHQIILPSSPLKVDQVKGRGRERSGGGGKEPFLEMFQHHYPHTPTHTHCGLIPKDAHGSPSPKVPQGGSQATWASWKGREKESIGSIGSYI